MRSEAVSALQEVGFGDGFLQLGKEVEKATTNGVEGRRISEGKALAQAGGQLVVVRDHSLPKEKSLGCNLSDNIFRAPSMTAESMLPAGGKSIILAVRKLRIPMLQFLSAGAPATVQDILGQRLV